MKFLWTTLVVKDMQESLKFYKDIVGLKENRSMKTPQGIEIVFLGDGETQIELMTSVQEKEINMGADISLGFEVTSIEEKIAELNKIGYPIHGGPFQPAPYIKFIYVFDPNGLKIQFAQHL